MSSGARAHGDPPQALSIAAVDESGVRAVRLNEGLGLREGKGFRYLCPALWGADAITPALAIPGGPIAVGANSGLFLVGAEGRVQPHPDPEAAAAIAALSESDDGLFALQSETPVSRETVRVLAVEADRVRVLWSGTEHWFDLAAGDGFIQLVGLQSDQLHELRLSPTGEVLLDQRAPAPAGTRSVLARVAGSRAYIVAYAATLAVQLGRIEDGSFVLVDSAQLLPGPIETDSGELVIAHDQQLFSFDDEHAEPLAETRRVSCLRRNFGISYACSQGGLSGVDGSGLTDSLFELDQMIEPDLSTVPVESREACTLQWQRYQLDLTSIGVQLPATPDAGVSAGGTASEEGGAGEEGAMDAGTQRARRDDSGCHATGAGAGGSSAWLVFAALLSTAASRRRSRARQR